MVSLGLTIKIKVMQVETNYYQNPVTGEQWSKEQYDEYVKREDSRYEVACGSECYGCEKCEG